ncbi:MAG: DUF47 family protein [Gemmatimonadota bacterium]
MTLLFKQSRELEAQIDDYLDLIGQGGLLFQEGLRLYLKDREAEFEERLAELRVTERNGDELRRGIESKLYLHTLIPESRGDVLGLLEAADKVLNALTGTLLRFAVEEPELLDDLDPYFEDLAGHAVATADCMVRGCRAYFRDLAAVRDHISKAQFHRDEANRIAETCTRAVFRRDLRLSHKNQIRALVSHIEGIADEAEDVCDRLAIAAIKRHV